MPFLDITSLLTSLGAALHGTELRSTCDLCLRYKHLFPTAPPCQCMHSKQKEVGPGIQTGSQRNITVYWKRSLLGRENGALGIFVFRTYVFLSATSSLIKSGHFQGDKSSLYPEKSLDLGELEGTSTMLFGHVFSSLGQGCHWVER